MMIVLLVVLALGTALWLLWLWQREARRAGARLSPGWLAAGLLVPALGALVYLAFGFQRDTLEWVADYHTLRPAARELAAGQPPQGLDETVSPAALTRVLQRQLAMTPTADGWYALGLLYGELQAPAMSVLSARKALASDPDLIPARLLLAQSLVDEAEGQLTDEAREVLDSVLAAQPEHDGAWMLLGMAASQSRDYALAADAWRELLSRHADSEAGDVLRRSLAFAEAQQAQAGRFAEVSVTVAATDVLPGGSLFVFLQREGGAGQPLAARRVLAEQFPVTVRLRQGDWLQPFPDADTAVVVGARYSPSAAAGVDQAALAAPLRPFTPGETATLQLR